MGFNYEAGQSAKKKVWSRDWQQMYNTVEKRGRLARLSRALQVTPSEPGEPAESLVQAYKSFCTDLRGRV